MEYKYLGRTGLKVSELCMGSMSFGWTAPRENCAPVLDAFVEAGGNFIDTADIYSRWAEGNPGGVSEELDRRVAENEVARSDRYRHKGARPDGCRPQRSGLEPQAHHCGV